MFISQIFIYIFSQLDYVIPSHLATLFLERRKVNIYQPSDHRNTVTNN